MKHTSLYLFALGLSFTNLTTLPNSIQADTIAKRPLNIASPSNSSMFSCLS